MSSESLRYRIKHRTAYHYSGRIDVCHSLLHLALREEAGQEVLAHRLDIIPEPRFCSQREDYFGNSVHYFSIDQSHELLDVTSTVTLAKEVQASLLPNTSVPWDDKKNRALLRRDFDSGLPLLNFLSPSTACPHVFQLEEFLAPLLNPGKDTMVLAKELMTKIYKDFEYKPGVTKNSTTLVELLETRQGVCQDFAHLMIAALRYVGMPARYVSGYLETLPPPGQEKLQGADATHAWVEAYSPECGWVAFDPTNNSFPAHQHIKICHGRDYFDVQPLR
ncbi:MAG: transglutaminase family protein, partial [Verrucomicrobiota bacterium]